MNKRNIITIILAVRLITVFGAETPEKTPSGGMTLNDCLIYAREHAFANRINRFEEESAKINSRLAAGELMPYVGLSASGNVSFGRNIDPETNMYDKNETLSTGFGLSMSLPLFDGLVSINNLKSAKAARKRQSARNQADEDEISMEVIKAFYNVSYCKAMVEQMEEQLNRDETDLKATRRGEALGTKSGADVAEMEAIVASDEYELSNQRNLLAKAYLQLRSLMGMELSDEPLHLIEEWEEGSGGIMTVNPKIHEMQLSVKEGEYALRAARGELFPRLTLNGGVNTSYFKMTGSRGAGSPNFRQQWKDNMGQYVGFTFSMPLFDGLSRVNRVKKAKIELNMRKTQLEQMEYEVEKLTTQANLDLRGAYEEHKAAQKRMMAEETAFNAIRRKYELGSASAIDLYTSSTKLATARANLEGKRIQLKISEITAAYYAGQKLIRE